MDDLQYHLQLRQGDVGRYVILPGDPKRAGKIAEHFDHAEKVAENREYATYTGEVDGIRLSVTSTGIGCPSAAIAIEELIRVGADTFIRVGTSGALQPHIEIGDVVITTAAVREDGTSRQYVPLSYPAVADLDVTMALRQGASKLGVPFHVGIGHCKDAFYTEEANMTALDAHHRELWKTWEKANVLSTSMEASAIFTIASLRKVRAGEVLAAIGSTCKNMPIVKKAGVEEAIKVAIEAIRILDAQE